MTELTPIIMPSIVSRLRHLDKRRLAMAVLRLPLHIGFGLSAGFLVFALAAFTFFGLSRLNSYFFTGNIVQQGRYTGSYVVICSPVSLIKSLAGALGHITDSCFFIAGNHAVVHVNHTVGI